MLRKVALAAILLVAFARPAAALDTEDLLALVAMPLAVAAVSQIDDVPVNDLMDVVALLNQADVRPVEFVEVVRYVPVALVVEDNNPDQFVEFVRVRTNEGLRGTALVTRIEQRFQELGVHEVRVDTAPERVLFVDERQFVPEVVRTRVATVRTHPHGGPPGRLKKELGLKTGAEVVHRDEIARKPKPVKVRERHVDDGRDRVVVVKPRHGEDHGRGHGGGHGQDRGHGGGKAKGKGGKGKG